jgi:hypothetical protein
MQCLKCLKEVKKSDHKVVISTLNRPHGKDDHQEFHFKCFVDWFNEKVSEKSRKDVEKMRNMAVKLMDNPMIRGVLEKVGGGEMLQQMLGTPLVKPEIVTIVNKKEIEKKINDDRKKREGKTKSRSK